MRSAHDANPGKCTRPSPNSLDSPRGLGSVMNHLYLNTKDICRLVTELCTKRGECSHQISVLCLGWFDLRSRPRRAGEILLGCWKTHQRERQMPLELALCQDPPPWAVASLPAAGTGAGELPLAHGVPSHGKLLLPTPAAMAVTAAEHEGGQGWRTAFLLGCRDQAEAGFQLRPLRFSASSPAHPASLPLLLITLPPPPLHAPKLQPGGSSPLESR